MTTAILAPVSLGSYFDTATGAVKQVSLYFYRAGTLDPITVYTTSATSIPHPVPVISTGYGRVPPVWIGEEGNPEWRVRVFDQFSTLVEDIDHMPGPVFFTGEEEGGGGGTIEPGDPRLLATGDIVFSMSNAQPRLGFVLANGLPISNAGSPFNPSGTANANTEALFKWLWGQDLHGQLEVLPTRGATADGDWTALKAIRTPDLMGRTLVGMDAMGTAAANRLAGVPMDASGNPAWMGATGGAARHQLVVAETPQHNHTITLNPHNHANALAARHTHTYSGTTGLENQAHTHSVTITSAGGHNHDYSAPLTGQPGAAIGGNMATTSQTLSTTTNGAHTHGTTVGTESANHAHSFSGTTAQNPNDATRSVTMDDATVSVATNAMVGGDGLHNNTQPFMAVAVYIKL